MRVRQHIWRMWIGEFLDRHGISEGIPTFLMNQSDCYFLKVQATEFTSPNLEFSIFPPTTIYFKLSITSDLQNLFPNSGIKFELQNQSPHVLHDTVKLKKEE